MDINTKLYTDFVNASQHDYEQLFSKYGFYAFNDKQFKRGEDELRERGYADYSLTSIGYGGFVMSDHVDEIIEVAKARKRRLRASMENREFAIGAFYYEMCNHEYAINTQAAWDVCSCFGDVDYVDGGNGAYYLTQLGYGRNVVRSYRLARESYMRDAIENDWF